MNEEKVTVARDELAIAIATELAPEVPMVVIETRIVKAIEALIDAKIEQSNA